MAWETKQNAGDSGRVVPLPGATLGPALSPYAFCGNIGCTRECPGRECIQIPLPLSRERDEKRDYTAMRVTESLQLE